MHSKFKDEVGNKYNLLLVDSYSHYNPDDQTTYWNCTCDCGATCKVRAGRLRSGEAKSCGCLSKKSLELRTTHGKARSREYSIWATMLQRCNNPKSTKYDYYGGLGVQVSERWVESFENFFEDMGEAPEGMTLDRIDTKGDYCKENCRWTDRSMQQFNQKLNCRNTSGKSGVSFSQQKQKWRARINVKHKEISLGLFESFEDAVKAREAAELEYYGFNKE